MSDQKSSQSKFELLVPPVAAVVPANVDCTACSASCQSACKTSCTVGNQPCVAARQPA